MIRMISVINYVMSLGRLFHDELDFEIQPQLSAYSFWGIQIDLLLLLFGVLHKIYYGDSLTVKCLYSIHKKDVQFILTAH